MGRIFRLTAIWILLVVPSVHAENACKAIYGSGAATLRLATGSPGELGLVEVLAEAFNRNHDARLCWQKAGVQPGGGWYKVTKTFMTATLKLADAEKGYFMTDSSTWVAAKKELANLKILYRGDPMLINTYPALCQPPGATEAQPLAAAFIDFLVSDQGQRIVRMYGVDRYGEGLYNDAEYDKRCDH
ncbi:MAG TPA: substrate-binding domain-containing protein [Desulfosarcina sp.]|nr:substrate-binding domain-containing protein [Desulfosarcina sp.]